MSQPQGVTVGQVGIPALAGGPGLVLANALLSKTSGSVAQSTTDAQQAVVAQADATTDHMKAHKTGAHCRAVQVGLAGMEPQAQICQFRAQEHKGLAQGLGPIGEQS